MTAEAATTRFEAMYAANVRDVLAYCLRRASSADAHDVTAEVFTVAWRRRGELPPSSETLPWLYGVARNHVRSIRRSTQRLSNLRAKLNGQARHPEPGPEAVIVRNAEQALLLEALATLRPDDQEILRLRTYEQLSLAEIEGAAKAIEGQTGCGSVSCYLTSARTGQDVETLFRRLAEMVTG